MKKYLSILLALCLLWRRIVAAYLRGMPFILFLCSCVALLGCSLITSYFYHAAKYEVSTAAAVMFIAFGLWLLIKPYGLSVAGISAGCLCMALAVGCRPNAVFASALTPILLWVNTVKGRSRYLALTCAILPYAAVAVPLMVYNYARFGSVREFGSSYILTTSHMPSFSLANPMSQLYLAWNGFKNTLFAPIDLSAAFPYVLGTGTFSFGSAFPKRWYNGHVGLINFPVFWTLMFAVKAFRKAWGIASEKPLAILCTFMLPLGVFIAIADCLAVGMSIRYQTDYMYLFLIPSLVCGFWLWEHYGRRAGIAKVMCVLCILSALIALPLPSQGEVWPFWPEVIERLRYWAW